MSYLSKVLHYSGDATVLKSRLPLSARTFDEFPLLIGPTPFFLAVLLGRILRGRHRHRLRLKGRVAESVVGRRPVVAVVVVSRRGATAKVVHGIDLARITGIDDLDAALNKWR